MYIRMGMMTKILLIVFIMIINFAEITDFDFQSKDKADLLI